MFRVASQAEDALRGVSAVDTLLTAEGRIAPAMDPLRASARAAPR
jgi:hypothetical protein